MSIQGYIGHGLVGFGLNCLGLVTRPYETMRNIVDRKNWWELPYLAVLLIVYLGIASLVKTAAFRPFILTKQFIVLGSTVGLNYLFTSIITWLVGVWVGGRGGWRNVAVGWAYTLIPTLVWFLITSLLYVILPPPRTTSWEGILFSVLFLIFSSMLFFWKVILVYLTLRFSLRLDLFKIVLIVGIAGPIIGVYSYGMYRLGVFKVPFI